MKIYHEAHSFLKTFLVFTNMRIKGPEVKHTPLAQIICFKFEKHQTTGNYSGHVSRGCLFGNEDIH